MTKSLKSLKRVVVTGGAGQLAYALLFRIANGDMFGADQPLALHILEIPQAMEALKGVEMELTDCAFPLLEEIYIGSDPREVFEGVDYALLVGSKPRGPGMKRKDLLEANGKIFVEQGQALNDVASLDVKVLVVGNPCNTNCLIAMNNAPRIPRKNFRAMTRLDHNRTKNLLATKAEVPVQDVTNVTIWGNHSLTQVPDFFNARIGGKPAVEMIGDENWLRGDFIASIQGRGAEIIAARGKSSAASAANAVVDTMRAILTTTPEGDWFSTAVCSDGNSYGIEEDLIFSFPCRSKGDGQYEIVSDVPWNEFLREKIAATQQELIDEREAVMELIKIKI